MPLYEYECLKCGDRFERIQKFSDELLKEHDGCGGELRKLLSAPAIQFKGTGWYVTDYADRKGPGGKDGAAGDSVGEDGAAKADGDGDASSKESNSKSDKSKPEESAGKTKATTEATAGKTAKATD